MNIFLSSAKDLEIKGLVDHSFITEDETTKNLDKCKTVNNKRGENVHEEAEYQLENVMDSKENVHEEAEFKLKNVLDPEVGLIDQHEIDSLKMKDVSNGDQSRLGERLLNISCNECEKRFSNRSGLWSHKKSKHEGVFHTCDHCERKFSRTNILKTHVKEVHSNL